MLDKLHSLGFRAIATVETMDMGLEFDYVSSSGYGSILGAFGDWPAYALKPVEPNKWNIIISKIKSNTITMEDLINTDLQSIASFLNVYEGQEHGSLAEFLTNLVKLPEHPSMEFYCLFDRLAWTGVPEFFYSIEDMKEEFELIYCNGYTAWDDLDDEDLEYWCERIDDELSEFQLYSFNEEKA